MSFIFDEKPSDSPLVEMIWRTQSEQDTADAFISAADSHWEMVITTIEDQTTVTLRGPETKAHPSPIPQDAKFLGIIFKLGTFMPQLPTNQLVNHEINLPQATNHSFWLHGDTWQLPDFENADTFIANLVRKELLVQDPVVEAVLQNQPLDLSVRSVQRRFLRATGVTQGTFDQIKRAKEAATLLEQGISIADAVYYAGYADQPHLTRALKRFMGQTPGQILTTTIPE